MEFEANRVVSAEVLLRAIAHAAGPDRASRREVRTCALGGGTLGAGHGNADVRIQRRAEGSAGRDFERSHGRSQGAGLELLIVDFSLLNENPSGSAVFLVGRLFSIQNQPSTSDDH